MTVSEQLLCQAFKVIFVKLVHVSVSGSSIKNTFRPVAARNRYGNYYLCFCYSGHHANLPHEVQEVLSGRSFQRAALPAAWLDVVFDIVSRLLVRSDLTHVFFSKVFHHHSNYRFFSQQTLISTF